MAKFLFFNNITVLLFPILLHDCFRFYCILVSILSASLLSIFTAKDLSDYKRGLPGVLYDVTPTIFCEELLTADLSDPDSIRKVEGLTKGKEIRAWLQRHAGPDCRYVILDDMTEFDTELCEHTIQVNPRQGITDSLEAVRLLNI